VLYTEEGMLFSEASPKFQAYYTLKILRGGGYRVAQAPS
jgi:hypothetical protein